VLDENGCETTSSTLKLATPGRLDVSFPADLTIPADAYISFQRAVGLLSIKGDARQAMEPQLDWDALDPKSVSSIMHMHKRSMELWKYRCTSITSFLNKYPVNPASIPDTDDYTATQLWTFQRLKDLGEDIESWLKTITLQRLNFRQKQTQIIKKPILPAKPLEFQSPSSDAKRAALFGKQPLRKTASQPAGQPAGQPASQPAGQSAGQPAAQPSSKPTSQPLAQQKAQQQNQPATQQNNRQSNAAEQYDEYEEDPVDYEVDPLEQQNYEPAAEPEPEE
jgi:hypothetical protein